MPELLIRPRARRDLREIWLYSFRQWGAQQADRYLQELDRGFRTLLEFPDLGAPFDHISAGYRMLHVSRHLLFYRSHRSRIEIVRVLHEAMDVRSHL
jgi:toxin ParE1/3/4